MLIGCFVRTRSCAAALNNLSIAAELGKKVKKAVNPLTPTVAICSTAIKHPVPDRVKPSFVIFDIRSALSVRVPRCQKLQMTA